MEQTPKKAGMHVIINLYDWHTQLFHNVTVDITDTDAQNRMSTKANHAAWITGSLVQGRYDIANILGISMKQNANELFKDFQGIKDDITYPPLADFKKDWEAVSPLLRDALVNLTEEQLSGPDPFNMPGGNYTLFDTFTFCFDRESYCIGQIGLYRRLLGYAAMKYN